MLPRSLADALAAQLENNGPLIPLQTLVTSDNYHHDGRLALLAYGQSWGLFRMLMEERPHGLRRYLTTLYPRRTPEHRLLSPVLSSPPSPGRGH